MVVENDNINWDKINNLSKLPIDELNQMIAKEEEQIRKQMKSISK